MSCKVVGFISEKGGVGKTTACYHIAIALKRFHKKRVLVIDTDYQRGGITGRFIPSLIENFQKGEMPYKNIYHQFQKLYADSDIDIDMDIQKGKYEIDIIPSDPKLNRVSVDKLPGDRDMSKLSLNRYKHLCIINDSIEKYKDKYDYILIDTHPEISDLLDCVIYSCDYCVSPVKLDRQSSVGVASAMEAINNVNKNVKQLADMLTISGYKQTKFLGAIAMMAREYSEELIYTMSQEHSKLDKLYGVFKNYVTEGDGVRIAARGYVPVYDVDGENAVKQSQQFKLLTKEFIRKCV
ncbi:MULTISPECIES: ParA family protein [Clostridium]|uniref:ParA family protein n=1 Tax=Clostridium TaxID=1485 RepID=UPI0011573E08|nr:MULTISPECIES: ParA family protein [Clostridium]MDU4318675.1 ParA family protein [Clostridium sp.]